MISGIPLLRQGARPLVLGCSGNLASRPSRGASRAYYGFLWGLFKTNIPNTIDAMRLHYLYVPLVVYVPARPSIAGSFSMYMYVYMCTYIHICIKIHVKVHALFLYMLAIAHK